MDIFVAMIEDRHTDTEPFLFSTADAAISYARQHAQESATRPQDFVEELVDGFLYFAVYSVEGDTVWVVKKTLDAELAAV